MATKRSGKAANRRARQRPPRRPAIPQPVPRDTVTTDADTDAVAAVPPVGTPDAREAERLAPPRPLPAMYAGASRLSERAAAEYHYVGRDLRSIAVLTVVIVALLVVAWLTLPALGVITR